MQNENDPKPEDIQKEIEEIIQKKYGGSVQVLAADWGTHQGSQEAETPSHTQTDSKKFDLNFNYKPKDIKNHLDRYVIRQEEAKKALAIAVCDHYNRVRDYDQNVTGVVDSFYSKQNVLLLGPTGVGKTYLVQLIAELIGVPFIKADATRFSETGYVGANVDDMIKDLVVKAGNDISLAQYGIIYLDEADKLASSRHHSGRDVSGRGVQIGLLKLMEESEVDLRASHDMTSQIQAFMEFQRKGKLDKKIVNTRHILFIVSGAFSGLEAIIKNRMARKTAGINADIRTSEEDENIFEFASTHDFIEYGFEPEFVGRLPVRVACQVLEVEDLYHILKEAEGSIIRQYVKAFAAYGIRISFSDESLREIAVQAHKEKTGARGLMTVCERVLREYKFELPSTKVKEFVVTAEIIKNPKGELEKIIRSFQAPPIIYV